MSASSQTINNSANILVVDDDEVIREILREAAPDGYRWSALILGIVKSTPFQMRTSAERRAAAQLR